MLAAPIVKALLGKAVVPDDSPVHAPAASACWARCRPRRRWRSATRLLMVGTSFPYMAYLPEARPGQGRADRPRPDAARPALPDRHRPDRRRQGDAPGPAAAAPAAAGPLVPGEGPGADEGVVGADARPRGRAPTCRSSRRSSPRHVNDLLADDAIVTTDSGTITTWAARHIKMRRGMKFSCSGNLATMAPGLPYANAAQVAYPDRQVVAFVGDGGFTMLMGEFVTAVKYKLPIKVVIIKNNTLGQIKWEQMVFLGNPEYGVELQPIDFVKFAEACGGVGFRCETPEEVRPGAGGGLRVDEAGARRGGRRPVRAADARPGDAEAGAAPRRVAGPRRAEPRAGSPRRSSATRSTSSSEAARPSARRRRDACDRFVYSSCSFSRHEPSWVAIPSAALTRILPAATVPRQERSGP